MAPSSSTPDHSTRSARLVALALGLPFLLILAALMAMPFMAGDETTLQVDSSVPSRAGAELGGVRFSGTVHQWSVGGTLVIDTERQARLTFQLRGPDGSRPGRRCVYRSLSPCLAMTCHSA
jgi:hypothetical protein